MKKVETGKSLMLLAMTLGFSIMGTLSLGAGLSTGQFVFSLVGGLFVIVGAVFICIGMSGMSARKHIMQKGELKWYRAVDMVDDPSVTVNGVWNVFLVLQNIEDPSAEPLLSCTMMGQTADRIMGHLVPVYILGDVYYPDHKHYDRTSVAPDPILELVREELPDAKPEEIERAVIALDLQADEVATNYGAIAQEIIHLRSLRS